jgi:hypothetical protein
VTGLDSIHFFISGISLTLFLSFDSKLKDSKAAGCNISNHSLATYRPISAHETCDNVTRHFFFVEKVRNKLLLFFPGKMARLRGLISIIALNSSTKLEVDFLETIRSLRP